MEFKFHEGVANEEIIKLKPKSIEVVEILDIEIGYEISDAQVLIRLIEV